MGEPENVSSDVGSAGPNWRLIIIATIAIIVLFFVVLFGVRACGRGSGGGFTTVYSNLDLKDSAQVVNRLKELRIPYEIKEEGKAIAVAKEKADEARLGLALKGLPQGGVVGFEIFDETRFGATDFDKRIQLVRALSGELSRTISRIEGVENARVQIVVPKTELFATEKSPVTASVMLHLFAKKQLSPEQVRGIIHLVSSSVEGLQPENVTIIDSFGRILSGGDMEFDVNRIDEEKTNVEENKKEEQKPEKSVSRGVTPEEILMVELKAKEELETQLQRRAQLVLNKFYPPNTAVVKVNVELGPTQRIPEDGTKEAPLYSITMGGVERISVIVLVDNRLEFVKDLKTATMQAVAAAVGYDRRRGDQIMVNRVPFHLASSYQDEKTQAKESEKTKKASFLSKISGRWLAIGGGLLVLIVFAFGIYRIKKGKPDSAGLDSDSSIILKEKPDQQVSNREIEQARRIADTDPGRLAELVKSWIQEETQKEGE